MALTEAQQDAILAHLRQVCADTSATIARNTGGIVHHFLSGDDGSGARNDVKVVLERTIPALEETKDEDDTDRWLTTAREAERDLKAVAGYTAATTVDQIIVDTAAATGKTVGDGVNTVVTAAAKAGGVFVLHAVPWWLWLVGGVVVARKLRLV